MEIIRLESADDPLFEAVYDWNYRWWGVRDGVSPAEVRCTLEHSLNWTRLPQTFVAVEKGRALGMYQLSMIDDLYCRPDLYPWLIDVYVAEAFRGPEHRHVHDFEWLPFERLKDEYFYPLFLKTEICHLPEQLTLRTDRE